VRKYLWLLILFFGALRADDCVWVYYDSTYGVTCSDGCNDDVTACSKDASSICTPSAPSTDLATKLSCATYGCSYYCSNPGWTAN